MKIQPSMLSLQLLQNALLYLAINQIEYFLKTIAELRLEQARQFISEKQLEGADDLDSYYTALYTHNDINADNITNFISEDAYQRYQAITNYIIHKAFIAYDKIEEDPTNVEQCTLQLKIASMKRALTCLLPRVDNIKSKEIKLSKKEKK